MNICISIYTEECTNEYTHAHVHMHVYIYVYTQLQTYVHIICNYMCTHTLCNRAIEYICTIYSGKQEYDFSER